MDSPQHDGRSDGVDASDAAITSTPRDTSDAADTSATDLASAYAELQNLLVDRPDVTEFLSQVAVLAAGLVAGSSCGITTRRDHETTTAATSDEFAAQLDEIQYGRGQGPCLQTLNTNEVVHVNDLASDDRWGQYRMHALTYGVRSSLSLPLSVDGVVRGALNLYSTAPASFTPAVATSARAFARQAATALTIILRNTDQTVLEVQLREALTTRAVIDQAVGIIMGQQRVTAADAFAVLRHASQTRNRKLRDIAAELIENVTGHPPMAPRPFTNPR